MRKSHFSVLLFLLLSVNLGRGQSPSMVFHQLSIEDGLSEGTVRTIIQDSRGFMWFGTEDGLNKYDGYTFTAYKNNPHDQYSITSNNIKCLYNDTKGRLWVGTRYGVSLYDPLLDKFYNFNSDKYPALKSLKGDVENILQDSEGKYWVLTSTHGLYSFSSLAEQAKQYRKNTDDGTEAFFCMDLNEEGDLWIGTFDGLIKFDTEEEKFIDYRNKYGRNYQIRDVCVKENWLWLATIEGLKGINLKTKELKAYKHDPKDENTVHGNNTIRLLPEGDSLFIAIDGDGLDVFVPEKEKFYHYTKESGAQLSSNNITAIYKDGKGTLWLGTFLNGINFSNDATNFFVMVRHNKSYTNSLKGGVVTSFLKDSRGDFWVATDGGGLYVKRNNTNKFNNFRAEEESSPITSDAVISLLEDQQNNIWVTTYTGGLTKISPDGKYTVYYHNPQDSNSVGFDKLKALVEYEEQIWVSTYGMGLSVFDKKTGNFHHYRHDPGVPSSIPSDWSYWFFVDSENVLWIATFEGLCKFLPQSNTFKTYRFNPTGNAVDQNYIFDIFEDSKGQLWLGTNGGGLVCFDREKETFVSYTIAEGLSDNAVRTVIEDDDENLWLATNNGVSQFNLKTKEIEAYTINDGLPPCSFFFNSKYKDSQGKMYFGTNEGYLIITPSLAGDEVEFPAVALTEISIFNVPLSPDSSRYLGKHITEAKKITLPYDQNTLSFEFAALNFNVPRHNFYAYQLEGFDKGWSYIGKKRTAKYTNLNPGAYVFKVKATNDEKLWGDVATSFTVIIYPPFWATWWFRGMVVVFLIGGVVLFFYWRTRAIRKRNEWLQDEVKERTQALEATNEELSITNEDLSLKSAQILKQQKELLNRKQDLEENLSKLNELTATQQTVMSVLAHDLRGPMQSITVLTEQLKQDHPEKATEMTHLAATRLLGMVEELLDWCVWSMTDSKPDIKALNALTITEKVMAENKSMADTRGVKVHLKNSDVKNIQGNERILSTTLRNILSNAIKYSEKGGDVEISINERNGKCCISIRDEGIGMNSEQIEALLDTTKFREKQSGAGIGMALSIDLLKKIEATIQIDSVSGKGTEMKLLLPFTDQVAQSITVEEVSGSEIKPYKGKKILLVDDDHDLRWGLMNALSETFELQEASTAEKALEILKDWQPDMCVLDIKLPGMNGIELCKRIKNDRHISHIGCIMLTGEQGTEINQAAFEAGAESYLNKPVNLKVLTARIAGYFKNKTTYLQDYVLGQKNELVVEAPKQDQEFMLALTTCIEEHMGETSMGAELICEELAMSRTGLYRKVRALTGQTVNDMIRIVRLRKAMKLLKEGKLNISQIALEVGFNSLSYFTTSFKKHFGISPSEVKSTNLK